MTRILVVDDTPDMLRLMAVAMQYQGYDVVVASDGRAAIDLARTICPDVILLDIMMPDMSGLEVMRRLKEEEATKGIPVLLVSAMGEDGDVVSGLDQGAYDYVAKPFTREVLAARVRAAIRSKENHDQLAQLCQQLQVEIAERQRVELELAHAQKLESIGRLAAGIAHEINTPTQYVGDNIRFLREVFGDVDILLDTLLGLVAAAKDNTIPPELIAKAEEVIADVEVDYIKEETPRAIAQSLEGVERVAHVVRTMKEFSHPGTAEKQSVDLNRAIESTLTVSRSEWKYVADLVTDFDPLLPQVSCFAGDLNQVILNLVVNAAQAIAKRIDEGALERGTIRVSTRQDGDWVEVGIGDNGSGIPDGIRDRVFEHFFTTKEVGKGTGQGLAIAHAIVVQKHHGTIHFESKEGAGTTFIVRLPIDEVAADNNVAADRESAVAC